MYNLMDERVILFIYPNCCNPYSLVHSSGHNRRLNCNLLIYSLNVYQIQEKSELKNSYVLIYCFFE